MLVLLILAAGCATLQAAERRSTEQLLVMAGFRMQVADTPERVDELQSLPAKQLIRRSQNSAVTYIFSDPLGCHCLYVGGEGEYREYQRLRMRNERAYKNSLYCRGWPWCTGYGG